jgi:cytochrome b561
MELQTTYDAPARILHWLTALIVIPMIPVGILIADVEDFPGKETVYNAHRSLGFVLLVLVLLRLAYRLTHRPPPLPAHMPMIQKLAAETVHWALYAALIAQPIVGWVATNAYPAQIQVFGLFTLPALVGKDEALSKLLFEVHFFLGIALAFLITVHIAGALFHTIVQKDGIIRRMWPA